jgi:hypothetical protein
MSDNSKRSSLLQYVIIYECKKFFDTGPSTFKITLFATPIKSNVKQFEGKGFTHKQTARRHNMSQLKYLPKQQQIYTKQPLLRQGPLW